MSFRGTPSKSRLKAATGDRRNDADFAHPADTLIFPPHTASSAARDRDAFADHENACEGYGGGGIKLSPINKIKPHKRCGLFALHCILTEPASGRIVTHTRNRGSLP